MSASQLIVVGDRRNGFSGAENICPLGNQAFEAPYNRCESFFGQAHLKLEFTRRDFPAQQLRQQRVAQGAVLMGAAHSFASASCRSLRVLPSFVFQSTRPLAARPCTTPAAVDGDGKT